MITGCEHFRQELSSFLDGELEISAAQEVTEHLRQCSSCSQEYEELKAVNKLFDAQVNQVALQAPDIWSSLADKLPSCCEAIVQDLSAYVDNELCEPAEEGIKAHLAACQSCADELNKLSATQGLLSEGLRLPEKIKVDLWPAVKARLNEDCALIQSELSAFIDQEVATLRHRAIVGHLLDCPNCRLTFDGLFSVGDLMRTSYKPDIAEDFDLWPAIKAKLQVVPFAPKAKPQAKVIPLRPRILAAVASAVLVVLAGSLIFVASSKPEVRPVSAETYLLEHALGQPSNQAELVVYEGN